MEPERGRFRPTVTDEGEDEDMEVVGRTRAQDQMLKEMAREWAKAKAKQPATKPRTKDPSSSGKKVKRDTIPVRIIAEKGLARFDIWEAMATTPITMALAQLVDASTRTKAQILKAMQPSISQKRKAPKDPISLAVHHIRPSGKTTPNGDIVDYAYDQPDRHFLGYIKGLVEGVVTNRILIDGGSVVDLISPYFVQKHHLPLRPARVEWQLRLADDSRQEIKHCVTIALCVEGIHSIVTAYVVGEGMGFDLLVSKCWLRRHRAVEDYGEDVLVLRGKAGVKRQVSLVLAHLSGPPIGLETTTPNDDDDEEEEDISEEALEELLQSDNVLDELIWEKEQSENE